MEETPLPDKMGPYDILRVVGSGGMGTVYLGRHVETQLEAAVKVLPASLAREPGTTDRFEREIGAMRQLKGPHIVKLFESGFDTDSGQMYFAMEYVPGQTLADSIRAERRLPWDQSVDIAIQVCAALKTAHASGVVHRDLKPSNLLIGDDGIVKLTDFGVAQVFAAQRLTVTGGVIGTAEYMSPEQAQGRRCTRTSDLYSLGAVLYVMLTGRPPFTGKNTIDIIQKHTTARFDRPSLYAPDLPRLLEDVVCRLLEKDPAARYADAHVVSLRLKEVVKRVELASQNRTISRPIDADSLMSPTMAASHRSSPTGTDGETLEFELPGILHESEDPKQLPKRSDGPGPATIMRDAFRAEALQQRKKSAIGALFDNTWFLIGCLVLLIVGGVFAINGANRDSSPIDDIELLATGTGAENEIARFHRLAKAHRRYGDTPREQKILIALRNVIAHDDAHSDMLQEINQRLKIIAKLRDRVTDDFKLAEQTLERAADLVKAGDHEEAVQLLDSIAVLYGNDVSARQAIRRAAELRQQIADTNVDADDSSE